MASDFGGAISVDATVALKAMRGWPPIDPAQVGLHAVQLHWDHEERTVTLTLTNVETSTDLAQSFLPLFDGLHDFPRYTPYAHEAGLPAPNGLFAVSPGLLKALMAAANATDKWGAVRFHAHSGRVILMSAGPVTTESSMVHTTAALAPMIDRLATDDDTPGEQPGEVQEVWPDV